MANSPRFSGKLILAALVLACAGAVVWLQISDEDKASLLTPVREQVQNLLSGLGLSSSDNTNSEAGTQTEVSGGNGNGREFSAAIRMMPRSETEGGDTVQGSLGKDGNAESSPEDALLARVDKAITESGPSAPDGDSVSGVLSGAAPGDETARDDSVVTGDFVQDLANWFAASYTAPHHEGQAGYSAATLEKANSRYSSSSRLRSVEKDALRSRASILKYVYTPGMLEALYLLYSPRFVSALEEAARRPLRGKTLENWQVADLFNVYGEQFQRLASSLNAAADTDLPALAGAVWEADKKEHAASEAFALAYTAHAAALDAERRSEADAQSRRMMEQSRLAGLYAGEREQAQRRLVSALRAHSSSPLLSSADLLFIGEWIARHNGSVEATRAAASICERMAALCSERAQAILSPAAPAKGSPAPEATAQTAAEVPAAPAETAEPTASSSAKGETTDVPVTLPASNGTGSETSPQVSAQETAPAVSSVPAVSAEGSPMPEATAQPAAEVPATPAEPAAPAASSSAGGEATDAPNPASKKSDERSISAS
ncbi:hypothetical protein [uncultured Mailhella sp.]|uniref:hypothetical protein n=1 Tax=uncultured Mailhella sp. TaxID=1981031 RepID=UPI00260AA316|nr:hypothetical protein [uncultured Mailhella sp.]